MEIFSNETEFWATVNQWVRDGSNITGVDVFPFDDSVVTQVTLMGADGCTEELSWEDWR